MELVIGCQTHRCMKTRCKKNNEASCKFDFPKLPSVNTIISKGRDCEDYKTMPAKVKTRIDDVYKLVKNKLLENGKEFCSLHEFLKENGISAADYDLCLLFHHKEPTVILKRNPNECWINSYNPHSLKLLKSNQDISFALRMYGCICYLLSYLCKAERNVSKLMKEAMIKENETASLLSSMKNIWMNKREMSYPEAIFHLLSLPLLWKSRDVVFLSTNYPENRIRLIKQNKSEGDKQVFHDGIIEYYQNRPMEKIFETMPLVTFASWYVHKCVKSKLSDQDGEETCENIENSKEIQLLNGKGFMVKKFSKNIIRLPKLNLNEDFDESEQFFFSKLMTYVPWRCDRLSDVKCGFNTFKECYAHHAESIKLLMQEYEKGSDAINDAFLQISEREPDLDKNVTELQNGLEENIENNSCFPTDEDATLSDDDFAINTNQTNSSCQFEETIKRNSLYYQEIRELNNEQLKIFWHVLNWARQKRKNPIYPSLHLGIIGGAGTGKTKVINILDRLIQREFTPSNPGTSCVKISFTGMASANIDGRTWHSFLGLGKGHGKINGLKDMKAVSKATTRDKLKSVQVVIEDEMSLESSQMDNYMNDLLNHVFETPQAKRNEVVYGDISMIKVGDFMQLNMFGTPLYENVSTTDDPYAKLRPNLWKQNFKCFELSQCMRQKEEHFANILKTARFMSITTKVDTDQLPQDQKDVLSFLHSKVISKNHPNYPHFALHLFPTNVLVNQHNEKMISHLVEKFQIVAEDSERDETGSFCICDIQKVKDDQGLPSILTVGIGARAMITKNENVEDKIVNGTIGTIVAIDKSSNEYITTIWLKPDDNTVGHIKRKTLNNNERQNYPFAIPIKRVNSNITVAKNSTYKRKQFPLKLCYAATIHKYQGRSLDEVVIGGFNGCQWRPGMFYTALTRCRSAKGLYLDGFNSKALISNFKGHQEIERIRKESMIEYDHPRLSFFNLYPKEDWVFISMQNVRSLQFHLQDTLSDPILMSSSIIAFTETCLQSNNWPGWSYFNEYTIYQKCRNDVPKDTNNSRRSGGVAVLVKKNMASEAEPSKNDPCLEMTTLKSSLFSTTDPMTISLIYKDQDMKKTTFLTKLENVFSNHQNHPAVVLGDFNIDMNKSDCLRNCAFKYGFAPLVNSETTINGSLLDQIFVNDTVFFQNAQIVTLQSYYSDHDLVIMCIPKTSTLNPNFPNF